MSESEAVRPRIAALIARKVTLRFALTAEALAGQVIATGEAQGLDGERLLEYAGRLSLDDLYLAAACAGGEEAAWEECARRHFAFVRDFAGRYLRDPEARDVADEVIAALWQRRKIGRFDGRSTLRTWLGAVVAHAALNALKAARPRVPLDSDEFESWRRRNEPRAGPRFAEHEGRGALRQLLVEALGAASSEARLLLLLHYEQGLSLDEMGVVIGASKSTMSRRLRSTCDELRRAVDALAQARLGESADALREGIDLGDLDLDLRAVVGEPSRDDEPAMSSKQWGRQKTAT